MKIYPHEIALAYLTQIGVVFDEVYNDRDGIHREQLSILTAAPFLSDELKSNAYQTIHRLYASANRKNIDFTANIKNTLTGTVSSGFMEMLDEEVENKDDIMIKWLPSSAEEADAYHALQYGKVMSLGEAIERGLGIRYNCQCGMETMNTTDTDELKHYVDI